MEEKQSTQAKLPESEEQEKIIKVLEERLEKHAENRRTVQGKFEELRNKLTKQVDDLEERINRELEEKFIPEEDRLQAALNELRGKSTISALQNAKVELRAIQSYDIIENKEPNNDITALYELKIERRTVPEDISVGFAISEVNSSANDSSNVTEKGEITCDPNKFAEERERFIGLLEERLEKHDKNRKIVQDKLTEICEGVRAQVCELEDRTNRRLEEKFTSEDNRLQAALNELRTNNTASTLQKVKAELLVKQSYEIIENKEEEEKEEDDDDDDDEEEEEDDYEGEEDEEDDDDSVKPNFDLTTLYELKAERRIIPELTEMRKPTNVRVSGVNRGIVSVEFTCLNPDEERVLSDKDIANPVKYKCLFFKKGDEQEDKEYPLDKDDGNDSSSSFSTFTPDTLEAETPYATRVKIVVGDRVSEWSDEVAEFTTPEFKGCCVWKECPSDVDDNKKYNVDEKNPRISTKINISNGYCTIIGNTYIPLNKVIQWNIKVLKSNNNNGGCIFIGTAPNDIGLNVLCNYYDCGWYFDCYSSSLWSGPPHSYRGQKYGPRKRPGQYVHTGDSVGVVVDTKKGELSFVLNGVNHGVAYCGIPLDKPLVPCVLLYWQGDSVELII